MELKQQGEKLSGNFDGDKLEGTLKGNSIYLLAKDEQGGTDEGKGTLAGATITGTIVFTHADDAAHPQTHKFTAELVPARRTGTPQRHEFVPATFYRQFSAANKPVLTMAPGDSVHTTTVDAGGMRSEEHTSELQSPCNLVCRLLLEKKKKTNIGCMQSTHTYATATTTTVI